MAQHHGENAAQRRTDHGDSRGTAEYNLSLGERRIDGQFVSIIYAVWDDERRSLQVANSGLPRPIIMVSENQR